MAMPLKDRPAAQVLFFAGAITLIRFAVAAGLEPSTLEAYYWEYAQHPSLSYLDHPGMIGWMIWLSTALFGDGMLGMRVIPILAGGGAIWMAFLAGRRLYGETAGRLAALLVGVLPMTFEFGARATPDAPLLLFWMGTIWALSRALSEESHGGWILAGVFLGLAMLSKYHAFFIPLGMAGFLLFSPEHRRWLRRREPWCGLLVAVALFTPVIVWNATHEWRSLAYQLVGRFAEDHGQTAKHLREFWRDQLLLATPVVGIWAWGAGLYALRRW
ncbi:MAG TPA: glycosyltransferase family 39 protein, partial [Planctomycetota bacterium]|nr:glycosyltransferase family 39 protein [Planctomycetota bacterium]